MMLTYRRARPGLLLLALSLLALAPRPALAGAAPAESAVVRPGRSFQEYVELGARLFRNGDYPRAIEALEAATRLEQPPRIYFNLARAYQKAARRVDALAMYQRYLGAEPTSPRRAEVEGHIATLRAELEADRQRASQVVRVVEPAPAGAVLLAPTPPATRKRPAWVWGLVAAGAAVAVGAGITAGVLVSQRAPSDPMTLLGTRTVVFP